MKRFFAGLCVVGLMAGSSGAVVSEMTPPPVDEVIDQKIPKADYHTSAQILYQLGLLKGSEIGDDGQPDFDLQSKCTRAEAAVMLVRLLGKEEAAQQAPDSPFTDLNDWQKPAVNFLYQKGIVSGTENNRFEPEAPCSVEMYATMMLRALGYSDQDGDFTYDTAVGKAIQIGLIDNFSFDLDDFKRDDAIQMNRMALELIPKGQTEDLLAALVASNVVPVDQAERIRAQSEQVQALKSKIAASAPYQANVFAALMDQNSGSSLSLNGTLIDEGNRARLDGILAVTLRGGYTVSQQVTIVRDSSGITISKLNGIGYRDDQVADFLRHHGILSLAISAMPARSLVSTVEQHENTYFLPLPEGKAEIHFNAQGVPEQRSLSMTLNGVDYQVTAHTDKFGPEIRMDVPSQYTEYIKLTNTP